MNEILSNTEIAVNTQRLVIYAPRVAAAAKAGQFVILRIDEDGERVPFTIADVIPDKEAIVIIIQAVGETSEKLKQIKPGGQIKDLLGPLGNPSHVAHYGRVLLVAGGYGAATLNMLSSALKRENNEINVIIGAKRKELVIFDPKLQAYCKTIEFSTDDGSLGIKGSVIPLIDKSIKSETMRPDCVFAVGPLPMMKAVSKLTNSESILTYVSLNPIMMDGAGLCGGCRVLIDGKVQFACVDGPEFNASQVDFEDLMQRNKMYKTFERNSCRLMNIKSD